MATVTVRFTKNIVLSIALTLSLVILQGCETDNNPTSAPAYRLKVVYPNGGENIRLSDTLVVSWEYQGFGWDTLGSNVSIFLIKSNRKYMYVTQGASGGFYTWIVYRSLPISGDNYKIRVQHLTEPDIWDESDSSFSIY